MDILNPILTKYLGSIIRAGLTLLVPSIVAAGIWTPEESTAVIATASAALSALAFSFYEKYKSQQKLVTALAAPAGATELEIEKKVTAGHAPTVMTKKTKAPKLTKADDK